MATMVPDIDPQTIANNGERLFYQAAACLSAGYTVFYSYKYRIEEADAGEEEIREADFVLVHPSWGFLVVEVKQGEVFYANGLWHEFKGNGYQPMKKNPVEQAKNAMFALLHRYEKEAGARFPLKARFAICFPKCNHVAGALPAELNENSVFLFGDLDNLEDKISRLFGPERRKPAPEAVELLREKILAPTFKVFTRLEERIEMFHRLSERALTEEQERILQETELDKRKIFFGAAGTGKTFLAMEKAKKLTAEGKKVFLTCFNKNLAQYLIKSLPSTITVLNFHDYLLQSLLQRGISFTIPQDDAGKEKFFNETLPAAAFDLFADLPETEKFDSILVDEGQDFRDEWFSCLESMLKKGGEFYVFADPHQNLFQKEIEILHRLPISKHKLTRNLRNTEPISQWISTFLPGEHLRSQLKGGLPVSYFPWDKPEEEKRLIERELGRLVSQGIPPKRILILSPHVREKSSLAGLDRIKDWPVVGINEYQANGVRFATIRSFKGLEADIVFLIGLKKGSPVCTETDIYVGGSRARFLLYVFHERSLHFTN